VGQKSSIARTIEILKRLNEDKKLCVSHLSIEYGVSDRTIRRDFELIRDVFGDFMSKDGECYRAYQKVLLDDVMNSNELLTLANIINLFSSLNKNENISQSTKDLVKKSLQIYDFKSRPFEDLAKKEILKTLEHTIKFNKEVKILYRNELNVSQRRFEPYKILFVNENFYLSGVNRSKNGFELLRISLIEEVKFTSKTFSIDKDIEKFIRTLQTPWATFGSNDIVIKLQVDKSIRRFFRLKKYLPSQKIVQTFENGDIEVNYCISNFKEVEEIIIKWLPKLTILAPNNLKKHIKNKLRDKLNTLK